MGEAEGGEEGGLGQPVRFLIVSEGKSSGTNGAKGADIDRANSNR
jgi:hypothetical protein